MIGRRTSFFLKKWDVFALCFVGFLKENKAMEKMVYFFSVKRISLQRCLLCRLKHIETTKGVNNIKKEFSN